MTLEDHLGNRDGIGAVITLTDDQGNQQRREIQLGGGFMSFDAPRATFGFAAERVPSALSIRWADGMETHIKGLQRATQYHVTRQY